MVGRSKGRSDARLDKLPKYAYSTIYENTCGNFRQKQKNAVLTEILTTNRRTRFVYVAGMGREADRLFISNFVPEKLSTNYEAHANIIVNWQIDNFKTEFYSHPI